MASRNRSEEITKELTAPSAPQSELKEAPAQAPVKELETTQGPLVSFGRWFQSRGFKAHWKGGMEAFTDTTGRKTV